MRDVLTGGTEMSTRIREFDWARTPFGPIDGWPTSLRSTAAMVLENRFPMLLWWGSDLRHLYNDAYVPVLGGKHPRALAQPAAEVWSEIWHILGPQSELVMQGKGATWNEHLLLPMNRKGFLEETYFTFSYSPVRDDEGAIAGVLVTCQETTLQVQGERQLRTLRDLGAHTADAKTAEEACRTAASILMENDADVPFALLYLADERGSEARLVASTGLDEYEGRGKPPHLHLGSSAHDAWPLPSKGGASGLLVIDDVPKRIGAMPGGRWKSFPEQAVVLTLTGAGQSQPYGFLIAGVSPLRPIDDRYKEFFRLTADRIVTAISSARALEEERRRAEALAEIDRAKTVFFSNVSHEFRTPLTLMLGPLEDLLTGVHGQVTAEQREQLELLQRSALRLQKLVNSLLDFSRIEAGRIQSSYEPVDLATLTRDLASAFRSAVERAGLTFQVDCPPLEEPVFVDREMWEKIVLNLLSNAVKFTFEGGIDVSLRATDQGVVLRVKDTGVGVPQEELPRLFERFHRVAGTRARTYEGSGIGLALVQELAKLHGGSVTAESREGVGTTFTVTLPKGSAHLPTERIGVARTAASTALGAAPFVEEALRWLPGRGEGTSMASEMPHDFHERDAAPESSRRILFADDNADMRDYVHRLLKSHWAVEVVEDGAKALEAARARRPDVILTDVMMPGLDGFALLRELRKDDRMRFIPVVMLSARAGEEARIEGLQAGAEDYLVKPFSARELLARVRTQLELARLREERVAEMERAVRFSEMFIGILSHDLRNPLSSISAAAGLLSRRADSEKFAKPVRSILNSADRMERMIAQLLDFARIRLGRGIPLERARSDLATVVRQVIEEVESTCDRSIQFKASGDPWGDWDRDRLSQLASNLVANACQHSTAETPVHVYVDGSRPDVVRFEVRNQGLIPEDLLPFVFEPLKGPSVHRSGSSGLGLGLYITQQIARGHGGTIRVESEKTQGTRFIIELPRRAPAEHGAFSPDARPSMSEEARP